MKNLFLLIFTVFLSGWVFPQGIIVNPGDSPESALTAGNLVKEVFIRNNQCAPPISNFQYFDNTNAPFPHENRSWGYYTNQPGASNFKGIILTSGSAKNAEGPTKEFPHNSYGGESWLGDSAASTIANGQTKNATVFEFDFIPTGTSISFSYKFATSEIPNAMDNDVFAVILSGPGITNDPGVNGKNIMKQGNNPLTVNSLINDPTLIPGPFTDIGYSASTPGRVFNYDGLIPNQTYHIRFVVADTGSVLYDSGVFLYRKTFTYGMFLVNSDSKRIGNVNVCNLSEYKLTVNSDPNDTSISYQWLYKPLQGGSFTPIPGATERSYTAKESELGSGNYSVKISSAYCDNETLNSRVQFGARPSVNTPIPDQTACTSTGSKNFNLTQLENQITNESEVVFKYYHKVNGVWTEIMNPINFTIFGSKQIRVRVFFEDSDCYRNVYINYRVGIPPIAETGSDIRVCNSTGVLENFDLMEYKDEIIHEDAETDGMLFEFYYDAGMQNPIENPESFTSTSNPQTIYLKIYYPEMPDCFNTTEINLSVGLLPDTQDGTIQACDNLNTGMGVVDLTQNDIILTPEIYSESFYYYEINEELIEDPENFIVTESETTVYVLIKNPDDDCFIYRPLTIYLNKAPAVNEGVLEFKNCTLDENPVYYLPNLDGAVINQPEEDYTFSYYLTEENAKNAINPLPLFYTSTNEGQLIYVRVENKYGCFNIALVKLFSNMEHKQLHNTYYVCHDPYEPNTGTAVFDLTQLQSDVENALDGSQYNLEFYTDLNEAAIGANPIEDPYNFVNTSNPQMLYARANYTSGLGCAGIVDFTIGVKPVPEFEIESELKFCESDPDKSYKFEDSSFQSYTWYDPNGAIVSNTQNVQFYFTGIYELEVTQEGFECPARRRLNITLNDSPYIYSIDVNGNEVTVNASGENPPFQFSFDNGLTWYNYNYFPNLPYGLYEVIVKNQAGCISAAKEFAVLAIPNVITPNGDGINDYWEIRGLEFYTNANIIIFDRYGKKYIDRKVITDFKWDGLYNGYPVPSGNYWYIITSDNQKPIYGYLYIKNQ